MKKVFFTTALLVFITSAGLGQSYVRIDTIMKPYFQFDYEEWLNSDPRHPIRTGTDYIRMPPSTPENINTDIHKGDYLQYNYIESGCDVYGIAIWANILTIDARDTMSYLSTMPFFPLEYLYLYDATPDSLELMSQVMFDRNIPHPLVPTPMRENRQRQCDDTMYTWNHENLYRWDFYFDKPVHVDDSFYVGVSQNTGSYLYLSLNPNLEEELPPWISPWYGVMTVSSYAFNAYNSSCWMPLMKVKERFTCIEDTEYYRVACGASYNEWQNHESRDFFMVVPIIKVYDTIWTVDTPACRPVITFYTMSHFNDTTVLRWTEDGTHDEWEISYGPVGTDPEDGRRATCRGRHTWTYIDTVNDGVPMVAYVRTVCRELDTLRYSAWSNGVQWQTRLEGTESADGGGAGFTLTPNPTSGEVTVRVDGDRAEQMAVTVRDMAGREVLRTTTQHGSCRIDTRGWPQGTYLVTVSTPNGSSTRKLEVAY